MRSYSVTHIEDLSACGRNGSKQAPGAGEMEVCDCCGRKIKKVAVMADGARIGLDCAEVMKRLAFISHDEGEMYAWGISKRQLRFYLSHTEVVA